MGRVLSGGSTSTEQPSAAAACLSDFYSWCRSSQLDLNSLFFARALSLSLFLLTWDPKASEEMQAEKSWLRRPLPRARENRPSRLDQADATLSGEVRIYISSTYVQAGLAAWTVVTARTKGRSGRKWSRSNEAGFRTIERQLS